MSPPAVTIILPTYNRAQFLPEAFASIRGQEFTDWELIVVDDGSTDETRELVARLAADVPQPVQYIYQQNQGAYGARNTGLDHAAGRYIAFFDSDDVWLPHHLRDCFEALEANPGVDWVYGACRIVEHTTEQVIADSTFYKKGKPRPFLGLNVRKAGGLRVVEDKKCLRLVLSGTGLFCGLQNSMMRRDAIDGFRFESYSRNEAEDQVFVMMMLALRRSFAYFDNVHVIYHVHTTNSSGSARGMTLEKRRCLIAGVIGGFERFPQRLQECARRRLTLRERLALRQRVSKEWFWHLGYALHWQEREPLAAIRMFAIGLLWYPFKLAYWKTFLASVVCMVLRLHQREPAA